jgi:HK97 family phage prohead protease
MTIERRFLSAPIKVEARAEGETKTVVGYAALFNSEMRTRSMREVILPGAFDGCLEDDVRCLFNHDESLVLGRAKSGTVRISTDGTGLVYECDLPDTNLGNDLATLMARGDVAESSFAFIVADDGSEWEYPVDDVPLRVIKKISRLYDVSPVTYPAYADTSVALRSMQQVDKTDFLKLKIDLLKQALGG